MWRACSTKESTHYFSRRYESAYGASVKLKKGIFKIIESLKISALVINHDAGKYWSKSSLLIKPGIINISSVNLEYTDDKDELNSKIVKHFNPEAL